MKNKRSKFKRNITFRILIKFITALTIYIVSMLALLFLSVLFFTSFVWHGDEFFYPFLRIISSNIELFLVLVFSFGFITIFIYYWSKTLGYLQTIINATTNIYDDHNRMIKLPSELVEVESQMNQIKLNVSESKRAAKEAEQRKNDLVVYLAHDLKTPLTSVIGYLSLLRDEREISETLREKYLSISLDKAERLEDLINEFFEITRFNLTNITLEMSKVHLTRMLEQIIFEFNPMFLEKRLQCTLHSAPDLMIKCDIDKMQRVFDNLLRNAISYSFEDSRIDVTVLMEQQCIKIIFENMGNTIPKEKLNRIFEQFYRLDSARITKTGGAGLGLAISKEIVERHGGTITAKSEDEKISFELVLPAL